MGRGFNDLKYTLFIWMLESNLANCRIEVHEKENSKRVFQFNSLTLCGILNSPQLQFKYVHS